MERYSTKDQVYEEDDDDSQSKCKKRIHPALLNTQSMNTHVVWLGTKRVNSLGF